MYFRLNFGGKLHKVVQTPDLICLERFMIEQGVRSFLTDPPLLMQKEPSHCDLTLSRPLDPDTGEPIKDADDILVCPEDLLKVKWWGQQALIQVWAGRKQINVYSGKCNGGVQKITINNKPFDGTPSTGVLKKCDTIGWGYCGQGPAQLALAILLSETGDPALSLLYYQEFKREFISCVNEEDDFSVTGNDVKAFLARMTGNP